MLSKHLEKVPPTKNLKPKSRLSRRQTRTHRQEVYKHFQTVRTRNQLE